MEVSSSRNDDSASAAGFSVAECIEEKEDLKRKKN